MSLDIAPEFRRLLGDQDGVIARRQAVGLGISVDAMRHRVRSADWQRLHRGVYATFSGDRARETELWGALLRAGRGAALSHQTAAELYGMLKQPSSLIHVTVPITGNPARHGKIPGVVVHRSRITEATTHPVLMPPRTRVEDTVLDLVASAPCFKDGYDWICKAVGDRLTTAGRIREALDRRSRFPDRRDVERALGDAGQGALSNLELLYLRGVERRHKLPTATRQATVKVGSRSIYLDILYEDHLVCVELDGKAAHPAAEQWADKRRDRHNLVAGKIVTIRFGYLDLYTEQAQCQTAADVASVLRGRGRGVGRPCRVPGCPV
jgi:hypothetical protein